jgi:hypothetical protein
MRHVRKTPGCRARCQELKTALLPKRVPHVTRMCRSARRHRAAQHPASSSIFAGQRRSAARSRKSARTCGGLRADFRRRNNSALGGTPEGERSALPTGRKVDVESYRPADRWTSSPTDGPGAGGSPAGRPDKWTFESHRRSGRSVQPYRPAGRRTQSPTDRPDGPRSPALGGRRPGPIAVVASPPAKARSGVDGSTTVPDPSGRRGTSNRAPVNAAQEGRGSPAAARGWLWERSHA